jgi:hypothetical protein
MEDRRILMNTATMDTLMSTWSILVSAAARTLSSIRADAFVIR